MALDETQPGGHYIKDGFTVDANGNVIGLPFSLDIVSIVFRGRAKVYPFFYDEETETSACIFCHRVREEESDIDPDDEEAYDRWGASQHNVDNCAWAQAQLALRGRIEPF